MKNRLGLDMLTLLGMPPIDHVRLAADLGCGSVSLAISGLPFAQFGYPDFAPYPAWSLVDDMVMRRELKAALADTGIRIALGEGFRVRPDADVRSRADELDLMADLGTERINAVSMETDIARTHDQLAVLADMVIARGMAFIVEFAPPNAIRTLAEALVAADHIGRDRSGIMLDSMHFFRSGGTLADIAALDPARIGYAQLCDAPLVSTGGTYMQEAMFARALPGDGELPLAAWIAALPDDLDIGVEVPMIDALLAGMSPRAHAERVVTAARRLIP